MVTLQRFYKDAKVASRLTSELLLLKAGISIKLASQLNGDPLHASFFSPDGALSAKNYAHLRVRVKPQLFVSCVSACDWFSFVN